MVLDICSPLLEARPRLHDLCIPIAVTGVWRTAGVRQIWGKLIHQCRETRAQAES